MPSCPKCQSQSIQNVSTPLSGMGYVRQKECQSCGFVGMDVAFESPDVGPLSEEEKALVEDHEAPVRRHPLGYPTIVLGGCLAIFLALAGLPWLFGFTYYTGQYALALIVVLAVLAVLSVAGFWLEDAEPDLKKKK